MSKVRRTALSDVNQEFSKGVKMKGCLVDDATFKYWRWAGPLWFSKCAFTQEGIAAFVNLLRKPNEVKCTNAIVSSRHARAFFEMLCMAHWLCIEGNLTDLFEGVDLSGIFGTTARLKLTDSRCAPLICEILRCTPLLEHLKLGSGSFSPEVHRSCLSLSSLAVVDFLHIKIDDEVGALATHASLRTIKFRQCVFVSKEVLRVLGAPALEELVLNHCKYPNDAFEQTIIREAYQSCLKRVVFIGGNHTKIYDARFLMELLSLPSSLASLELSVDTHTHFLICKPLLLNVVYRNLVLTKMLINSISFFRDLTDRNRKNIERRNCSLSSIALKHWKRFVPFNRHELADE